MSDKPHINESISLFEAQQPDSCWEPTFLIEDYKWDTWGVRRHSKGSGKSKWHCFAIGLTEYCAKTLVNDANRGSGCFEYEVIDKHGQCYRLRETIPAPTKKYFLGGDNSRHWYLVDASKREEWDKWVEQLESRLPNFYYPDFAKMIGYNVSLLEFENPFVLVR